MVEIGLTDLSKTGRAEASPAPPLATALRHPICCFVTLVSNSSQHPLKDMKNPTLAKNTQILVLLASLLPLSGLPCYPNSASNSQNTCTIHALITILDWIYLNSCFSYWKLTSSVIYSFHLSAYKNYNLKLGSECNSILIFGDEGHFFLLLSILQIRI